MAGKKHGKNAAPGSVAEPAPGGTVSLRQFAALVGVDYNSAREALENGRIQFIKGTRKLDWEQSRASFQETRTHRLTYVETENDADAQTIANMTPLGRAKLRKESATANLKEIELAVMQGKYLLSDDVNDAVFKFSRTVRDAVMSIPDRVGSEVAAKVRESVRVALLKELDEELANKCLKRFSDAEADRAVREAWAKESRDVLESIDKKPKIEVKNG